MARLAACLPKCGCRRWLRQHSQGRQPARQNRDQIKAKPKVKTSESHGHGPGRNFPGQRFLIVGEGTPTRLNQITAAARRQRPRLLDNLPHLAGILHNAPARLYQELCHAFGIQILYNPDGDQIS